MGLANAFTKLLERASRFAADQAELSQNAPEATMSRQQALAHASSMNDPFAMHRASLGWSWCPLADKVPRLELVPTGFHVVLNHGFAEMPFTVFDCEGRRMGSGADLSVAKTFAERLAMQRYEFDADRWLGNA